MSLQERVREQMYNRARHNEDEVQLIPDEETEQDEHEHSRLADMYTNLFHKKDAEGEGRVSGRGSAREERPMPTLAEELRILILKIVYVLVAFFVVFTFIFGLHRNLSVGMQPSLRDGDLLFYYRLDKNLKANNIVVFEYQDELIASRVIAVEGDTVNITSKGLEINGHIMYEPEIYFETTQFRGGPTFPLTVEKDTVFCLGDNREKAHDSRMIGLIKKKDVKGKVMGVIRRRNL